MIFISRIGYGTDIISDNAGFQPLNSMDGWTEDLSIHEVEMML